MKPTTGNKMALERMNTDFFVYKGVKYPAGTMFKMQNPEHPFVDHVIAVYKGNIDGLFPGKYCIGYNDRLAMAKSFECREGMKWHAMIGIEKDKLEDMIVEILPSNNFVNIEARAKYVSDSNDFNLITAWIIYITMMLFAAITYKRVVGWIFLTVIFFWWRHKYKEEECVYYE